MTYAGLRRLALREQRIHETRPAWIRGIFMAAFLVLAVAYVQERDAAADERALNSASMQAIEQLQVALEEREKTPTIRLDPEGDGFRCQQFHIRREWIAVIAAKCEELARLITVARAAP